MRPRLTVESLRAYANGFLERSTRPGTFVDLIKPLRIETHVELRERLLNSTLADLLTIDGGSLCDFLSDVTNPKLCASNSTFKGMSIRVWGKGWDFIDGTWLREFELSLYYSDGQTRAIEHLTSAFMGKGLLDRLSAEVWTMYRPEAGYEIGNERFRKITQSELELYYSVIFELSEGAGVR